MKNTLVIGAAASPERYSHLAVLKLEQYHHPVLAIGKQQTVIGHTMVQTGLPTVANVHTVTLYINPGRQQQYYHYVIGLKPKRVIFNPGTENPAFEALLHQNGIASTEACTLVMLATGQY
jgi:uncharacterized protein